MRIHTVINFGRYRISLTGGFNYCIPRISGHSIRR